MGNTLDKSIDTTLIFVHKNEATDSSVTALHITTHNSLSNHEFAFVSVYVDVMSNTSSDCAAEMFS